MAGKVQTAAGPSGQMRRPAGNGDRVEQQMPKKKNCLLYTSDAADEL